MKIGVLLLSMFFMGNYALFGQILVDDSGFTDEQLVRDILINSNCAETSNYSSFTGTAQNVNGIAYFNGNGSDFPYEEGIILSTGRANDARGPNNGTKDSGTESWPGDLDLIKITNTGNLFNATSLQFDFVPLTNSITFNFLFASEEYQENYQCIYSDVFAFILTDPEGVSTNLAIVPGSNEPVRATTIRPGIEGQCAARNIDFFGKINGSDDPISFHGQTETLIAESPVTPGETYTIKLVISDNQDSQVDSAVFLEAGSFSLGYDLGEDRTVANQNPVCTGDVIALDTSVDGVQDYRWFRDGNEVAAWAGSSTVELTESGAYQVDLVFSSSCISEGNLTVDFIAPPEINEEPEDMTACDVDGDGSEVFDLSVNSTRMMGDQDAEIYAVTFFNSEADAIAFENAIENANAYASEVRKTLYARLSSGRSCYQIAPFEIRVQGLEFETTLVSDYTLCLDKEGTIIDPLPRLDTGLISSDYNFAWYRDSIAPENRIEGATGPSYSPLSIGTYYVKLENLEFGCEFSIATNVAPSQLPESVSVDFITDLFIDNDIIEINATGNSDYLYAVDDSDFVASNRFENLSPGEHTAFVTDVAMCSVVSEEFLVIDFPRFFTPNGDGTNDVWQIVGFPEIDNAEIAIFDKFGTLLYQFDNDIGWDGTINNSRLPASDYWFKITYMRDGTQRKFNGHFTLKR